MIIQYDVFETAFGWMGLSVSETGLCRSTLPRKSPDECVAEMAIENGEASGAGLHHLKRRLVAYFNGEEVDFAGEPIDLKGAPRFHAAAWKACRSIPAGETRSYGWLAAQAGSPRAVRAAGQAMARNRLPIIVPCHRVVASDGDLRGFGRGANQLDLKQRLLELESSRRSPA